MRTKRLFLPTLLLLGGVVIVVVACDQGASTPTKEARVARGRYLVSTAACTDCHTPWKMGPNGPEPEEGRHLSGHRAEMLMPPPPEARGPWITSASASMTAWGGPWGTSFTANLTPDPETGLGKWDEDTFVRTIRTGRHEGHGRPLLPPMPWPVYKNFNDEDLKSIFAYLQSIPAVKNRVPLPVPPAGAEPATK